MSFVSANDPTTVKPVETSLLRRDDIVDSFGDLVKVYGDQQRRSIEGQIVTDGEGPGPGLRLSSAGELRERRWTSFMYLVAQVVVIALGVAGAVWVAAPQDARLPVWMLATGVFAAVVIWLQHRKELDLAPETLQSNRDFYRFQIDEAEVESRRILLQAQADVYRLYGQADLEARQAQREAVALEAQRLDAQLRRRDDARRQRWDDIVGPTAPAVVETVESTVETVESTVVSTVGTVKPTVETVGATVDPALTVVLKTVVELYDQVDPFNPLIKRALPWSARSTAMSPADKGRVTDALSRLEPPLIELKNGRYYLNVADYAGPRKASKVLSMAWELL